MSKVKVSDVKPNDFVSFDAPAITGYSNAISLTGMVKNVMKHMLHGKEHRYIEIITEGQGVKGAYLAITEEIVRTVMTEEEQERMVARNVIRTLPRVVDSQGSDPEMFVVDKDGIVIPSFKFLPDKKTVRGDTFAFWDGFQAEFNIPGVSCLDQSVAFLQQGLRNLLDAAKKHDPKAELTIKPTLTIPPHFLTEEKDEHVQFGCMPSKNVYGMKGIQADGREVSVRSAGGHIHIGLRSEQKKNIETYIKALDAILGVACVSMFGKIDDPIRRKYYGLAGEYRTPSHGVEYRTLSNAWMCHPNISYIVFELARKVITLVDKGMFKHWQYNESDVISCINECNIPLAMEILHQNEAMFKDILMSFCYQRPETTQVVYNTFIAGVEVLIKDPNDLVSNWNLDGKKNENTGTHRIASMNTINPKFKDVLKMEIE